MRIFKRKKPLKLSDVVIIFVLMLYGLIVLYPFYNTFLVSIVDEATYIKTPFMLYPKVISLEAYKFIFQSDAILNGYKVTIFIVVTGVIYSLLLTIGIAYGLTKKNMPGRNLILNLIILTMFFEGGLVPSYMLVRNLGLMDSLGALIFPLGINTFFMLIMRNFFNSIPASLEEAATVEGANHFQVLIHVVLPISKPVIATVTLFYAVWSWNDWFNALLYIKDVDKIPLQLVLKRIVTDVAATNTGMVPDSVIDAIFKDGVKAAAIFAVMTPIMCLYPFLQKYFVKGVMVGAIKS